MKRLIILAMLAATTAAAPATAASFDDPDWPCIQRKVPHLSIGQMWAGPQVDDTIKALAKDDPIHMLAVRLAVRRTSMEEAEALIAAFADGLTEDRNTRLTALFAAIFKKIDHDRTALISGIGRYSEKQIALSEKIDARRTEIEALKAASDPDYDKIEEMEDELTWDTRIFDDRRQSLTYVCETPVILEQRVFALGRMIMERLED